MWQEPQKIPFQIFGVCFDAAHQQTKAKTKSTRGPASGICIVYPENLQAEGARVFIPPYPSHVLLGFLLDGSYFLLYTYSVRTAPAPITPSRKIKDVSRRRAERNLVPDPAGRRSWPSVVEEGGRGQTQVTRQMQTAQQIIAFLGPLLPACARPSPLLLRLLTCSLSSWLCKEDGQASS